MGIECQSKDPLLLDTFTCKIYVTKKQHKSDSEDEGVSNYVLAKYN